MATFTKINDWMEYAHNGANLSSDALGVAFSNTAPASESSNPTADNNGVLANVTQISYTNYSDDLTSDRVLEGITSTQTGGTYTLDANDFVVTASGGALADFRYIYIYNDTLAGDPLIGVWDHGSTISLDSDGDNASHTVNGSGLYTVA